ncbi:uncharacterized protein LOC144558529 [Carex rostrata]
MASYLYQRPPLSYPTSPLLYANPHIQVGTIPIISQIVIGSIPIFPTISTLENYLNPLQQQKREHETGLFQPSTTLAMLPPVQALRSIQWSQTPSSATSRCCLLSIQDSLQDTIFDHSKKEGDPHMLERKNIEQISTGFEDIIPKVGPNRKHLPYLALPTHANYQNVSAQHFVHSQKDITLRSKQKPKVFVQNSMQISRTPSKYASKKFIFAGKPKRYQASILGPRPIPPFFHCSLVSPQPNPLPHHSHANLSPVSPISLSILSHHIAKPAMTSFTEDEEAFIQQFIGLSTLDGASEIVAVPKKATSSTNWALCLLARIVTDRTVLDGPFAKSMVYAWGVDPATSIRKVEKNCYLIEFNDVDDLNSALLGGPWTYRGDLVALRQVTADLDLKASLVESAAIWVLFLNLPVNDFKDEGIQVIGQAIGTPVSAPIKGFIHGKRFVKLKIRINLSKAVKDTLIVPHPTFGQVKVYCSYEKVSRICFFCGKLGHEMVGCHDHARLTMLAQKPGQENRFKGVNILAPRMGEWLTDPTKVSVASLRKHHQPARNVPSEVSTRAGSKRTLENSEQGTVSSDMLLDFVQTEQQAVSGEGFNPLQREVSFLTFNKMPKSAGLNAPAPPP